MLFMYNGQCFPYVFDLKQLQMLLRNTPLKSMVTMVIETVVKQLVQWSVTTTTVHIHNLYQWLNKQYQSPYHLTNTKLVIVFQ